MAASSGRCAGPPPPGTCKSPRAGGPGDPRRPAARAENPAGDGRLALAASGHRRRANRPAWPPWEGSAPATRLSRISAQNSTWAAAELSGLTADVVDRRQREGDLRRKLPRVDPVGWRPSVAGHFTGRQHGVQPCGPRRRSSRARRRSATGSRQGRTPWRRPRPPRDKSVGRQHAVRPPSIPHVDGNDVAVGSSGNRGSWRTARGRSGPRPPSLCDGPPSGCPPAPLAGRRPTADGPPESSGRRRTTRRRPRPTFSNRPFPGRPPSPQP